MIAIALGGGLLLALLALALLPALLELRRPSDVAPLQVPHDHDNHVQRFAQAYRARLEAVFGAPLPRALVAEGAERRAVAHGIECLLPGDTVLSRIWERPVASGADIAVPEGVEALQELYAAGTLSLGAHSRVRAALSDGTARLDAGARVLRWLHAQRVVMAQGSAVEARVSADEDIELAAGAECVRAHATVVRAAAVPREVAPAPGAPAELHRYAGEPGAGSMWDPAGRRWIVFTSLQLAPHTHVAGHLIVRGDATLGAGCRIDGSLKVHGRLWIAPDVQIDGACVAGLDTEVGAGCSIAGPLVCEGRLRLRDGAAVGRVDAPTSITAEEILLHPGARGHGSVWAKTRVRAV